MVFGMIGFMAVIFLLWCFRGFSRDLTQGNSVGLLVRPVTSQRVVLKHNIQRVVRMSVRREQLPDRHYPEIPITVRSAGRRQLEDNAVAPLSRSIRSAAR
jgi:hypothetical protein